jgi:DNA-binding FadR family transcriptional regulator
MAGQIALALAAIRAGFAGAANMVSSHAHLVDVIAQGDRRAAEEAIEEHILFGYSHRLQAPSH